MKLQGNFDTSIQQLLDCMNDNTRFISDWNKGADVLNFGNRFNEDMPCNDSSMKCFFPWKDLRVIIVLFREMLL